MPRLLGNRHEVEDAFQATFLVLAVRARSIRRRGSVASWLHGVALRVAASERSRAARRRRHERLRAAMTSSTTEDSESHPVLDREQTHIIQEEIGRLPEKYRAAVVLCYLEGLTHEMAAEHLGWPVGSVRSRLAWARERLRLRLTRRGIAPDALPFDRSGTSKDAESAPSPAFVTTSLVDATVRGALRVGLGKGALAGIVSAEAIALMEGIVKSMTTAKLIFVTAAVLIAGLVTAGAGVLGQAATHPKNPAPEVALQKPVRQPGAQDPPRPAVTKPAADQAPLVLQAEVVDSQGDPLSDVEIGAAISYQGGSKAGKLVFERTTTNDQGQARLEIARESPNGRLLGAVVWAYQSGRALTLTAIPLSVRTSPPPIRLTLNPPAKWTITLLGPDNRPVAGLRIAPLALQQVGRRNSLFTVPDEWVDRLTTTTDDKGVATPTCLPPTMQLLAIRVSGPGVAPHALTTLDAALGKAVVKLGRPGRLVGIVRTADGQPLADIPVEVWVQASGKLPNSVINRAITSNELLRLDHQPLKTGPQGAFQTPPTLLSGSAYRVFIHHEGFVPFASDWVTLDGERTTIPIIRLEPLRTLTGQIQDRQGRALAGARVFLPAGGPATVTDAQGQFSMAGIPPGKTVVLAEKAGFRLRGWLVDPSTKAEMGPLTLVRTERSARTGHQTTGRPDPPRGIACPRGETAGALSDQSGERPTSSWPASRRCVNSTSTVRSSCSRTGISRAMIIMPMSRASWPPGSRRKTPRGPTTLVEAIPDSRSKASALMNVAKALPASERDRKNALLERAATLIKDLRPYIQLHGQLPMIAEQWLDMGERDRARLLLQKGKSVYDPLPATNAGTLVDFLRQLARLEPDQAVERVRKLPDLAAEMTTSLLYDPVAAVAVGLATDHPAEAERVFHLWKRTGIQWTTNSYVIQTLSPSGPSRSAASPPVRRGATGAGRTDPGLGVRGPRPGREGQSRRPGSGRPGHP